MRCRMTSGVGCKGKAVRLESIRRSILKDPAKTSVLSMVAYTTLLRYV